MINIIAQYFIMYLTKKTKKTPNKSKNRVYLRLIRENSLNNYCRINIIKYYPTLDKRIKHG